jgi:hypothetical protein
LSTTDPETVSELAAPGTATLRDRTQ